ncbi:MAG TPA: hypothetical protein VNT54_02145 [Solirubrobacteraceae bacterium]|nr:hypothetical protein [Solirubrobacteraceae bacterium]
MRRTGLTILLAAALAAAGCGGSPSPEETVSTAVSGLSKGDEKAVCDQLTPAAKRKLLAVLADDPPLVEPVRASTCEEAITKVHAQLSQPIRAVLEDGEVDDAKVDGDKAVVHVTGAGIDVELQKIDDEWKITDGFFNR